MVMIDSSRGVEEGRGYRNLAHDASFCIEQCSETSVRIGRLIEILFYAPFCLCCSSGVVGVFIPILPRDRSVAGEYARSSLILAHLVSQSS